VAPGLSTLFVDGCVSTANNAVGVSFSVPMVTATGSFTSGSVTYTDSSAAQWTNPANFDVTLTKLGVVGDTLEGTFSGDVIHPPSQVAQMVSGSFKVCRLPDEDAP
jgi:hypothetical protein